MGGCEGFYVPLAVISIALFFSLILNVISYSRRCRDTQREGVIEEYPYPEVQTYHVECPEGEMQQENPIYGNINPDRTGAGGTGGGEDVFYERMTTRSREEKSLQQDVSYASLDLAVGQKRRKQRNRQNPKAVLQNRGDQPSQQEFLEVDMEVESGMPCRNCSPMMSRNSIYLNSQQVTLESGALERRLEREREREREDSINFDSMHDDPTLFFSRANQSQAFEPDSR